MMCLLWGIASGHLTINILLASSCFHFNVKPAFLSLGLLEIAIDTQTKVLRQ
jgi:hypothetical protein